METIQEIKNELTAAFVADETVINSYSLDVTKTFEEQFSKVSIESIIFYVVAYFIWLRETALESWRSDVNETALATRYGTEQWWSKVSIAWQDGDMTSVIDGAVAYATIDETKQKIKFCAVISEGRTLYLRVATGVSPNLAPLTAEELGRFQSYLNDIKPLGIRVIGQSYPADNLSIFANIYYDGERLLSDVDTDVKAAIDNYLGSIVFGGVIYKSKMADAIKAISGIKDVEITNIGAIPSGGNNIWIGRKYQPKAGYAKVAGYGINYLVE